MSPIAFAHQSRNEAPHTYLSLASFASACAPLVFAWFCLDWAGTCNILPPQTLPPTRPPTRPCAALLAVGVAALGILGTFYAGYAISQIAKELKKPESGLGAVAAPATAAPAAAGVAAGAGATAAAAGAPSKGAEAAAAGKAASKAASSQPGAGGGGDGNMQVRTVRSIAERQQGSGWYG